MKRLFFALWPDRETRRKCAALAAALKSAGQPVAAANLHVTLVFLGNVDADSERKLTEAAASIEFDPIAIGFDALSHWQKPRIICLTAARQDAAAVALVERLNALVAALDIPVETRPYQAHVTLVRKAQRLPALTIAPIVWQADAFCLVESCGGPDGTRYRVLQTWRLPDAQAHAAFVSPS